EALEVVPRALLRRRAGLRIRQRVAAAERSAGEELRLLLLVERREELLDVAGDAHRLAAGRAVVGGQDAVDQGFERRTLVLREEAALRLRERTLDADAGCREGGEQHAEGLQEIAAAEQQRDGRGRRVPSQLRRQRGVFGVRETREAQTTHG